MPQDRTLLSPSLAMDSISNPLHVGPRVRYAREKLGITQDILKVALGFKDRQTVSDIENGKRRVQTDELLKLSDILDQDVEFFLDPFSVVAEAQYSWRASPTLPSDELDRFEEEASGWIGLLRWLREQDPGVHSPLKFALRLDVNSSFELAQRSAEKLVTQLQLGLVPALKLANCIERELDIPVLFVDTGTRLPRGAISGAACHLGDLGVILVNRRESAARRNFDLAHELFHSLTWEWMPPEHRESNSIEDRKRNHRVEQLADNFAAALLMPRASVDALVDWKRLNEVSHLVEVAAQFEVTPEAMGWRLLNLKYIDEGTRNKLAQEKRSEPGAELPKLFSESFVTVLHMALDKGRLSARKAAKALTMSLAELTQLFATYGMPPPFKL